MGRSRVAVLPVEHGIVAGTGSGVVAGNVPMGMTTVLVPGVALGTTRAGRAHRNVVLCERQGG